MTISNARLGRGALTAALALALITVAPTFAKQPSHQPSAHHQQRSHHRPAKHRNGRGRPAYWGAWIGNQITGSQPPWDMSAVSAFEGLTHKALSLIEFAAPFEECGEPPCSFYSFPTEAMETVRAYGAIPFFSWGSQSTPVPLDLNEPEFQLAKIAAGAYDPYIAEFAAAAARWGHPFFLRFNWEMNGNWFPWSEGVNGNQPGEYVAAWRHVHGIFASMGATNATWVWCPYAAPDHRLAPMARYYPGNAYVDWTCLDGFNWAHNGVNPQPWHSFDAIFSSSYRTLTRKVAPEKPVILGETASGGRGHAKAAWISQMFKQLRTAFPRIRGLIWFDQIDRGVEWPIETSPAVASAFSHGLHRGQFRGNRYYALTGSPIRAPK